MVILAMIEMSDERMTFVKVSPEHVALCKLVHGRQIQEPGNKPDMRKFYELLGSNRGPICENLGEIVDSPVGCTEFLYFWYD